jgi:AraC-like DNA-binding protein
MSVEYREWPVPVALQDRLRCVWRLRDAQPDRQQQTIYPDGCCELILHLGTPMERWQPEHGWQAQAACLFAAQQRTAIRLRAAGPLDCVGLRLQPAAASLVAGTGLAELRDQIVDLSTLSPSLATVLFAVLPKLEAPLKAEAAWQDLDAALGSCAVPSGLGQVLQQIEAGDGNRRIDALAVGAGLPLRTLQAQCLRWVGLTAKEYARLLRLQAMLRALDAGEPDLAGLSLDRGFSDQAHATRELRRLTGLPPARLLRALRSDREGDDAVALAAAFIRGGR